MAKTVSLTPELRAEYDRLYAEADVDNSSIGHPIILAAVQKIIANWQRYETVAATIGCPPHLVAIIHSLESSCNFTRHLHNGDPLTARTVNVPAGRPAAGDPPFSWEASAMDALRYHGLDKWTDWSVAGLLYVLERYNGWGYRLYHPTTKSPYLWSGTSIYTSGKYTSDGKWSSTAVSKQVGGVALLLGLAEQGHPYPAEGVEDADDDRGVVEAQAQPASPVLPLVGQRDAGQQGLDVGGTVRASVLPVSVSKKLSLAILGLLAVVLNQPLGLGLTDAQMSDLVKLVSAYVLGQAGVDAFSPVLKSLLGCKP